MGRAADEDGRRAAHRRGLLLDLRPRRRAHRDAGLLALHGQPGARRRQDDRRLDVDAQLPEPARQGRDAYLASAELAAISATLGKLPSPEEYHELAAKLAEPKSFEDTYRYLNFDQVDSFVAKADTVQLSDEMVAAAKKLSS